MTGVWHSPLPSFSFPRTQICVARVHICFAPGHCNIFSRIFVVICVFIFLFSCIFVFIVVVSCQCRLFRTSSRLHLRAPSVFLPFFSIGCMLPEQTLSSKRSSYFRGVSTTLHIFVDLSVDVV